MMARRTALTILLGTATAALMSPELVPHFVVDDAVERIKDGTITDYIYDPATAQLVRRTAA